MGSPCVVTFTDYAEALAEVSLFNHFIVTKRVAGPTLAALLFFTGPFCSFPVINVFLSVYMAE